MCPHKRRAEIKYLPEILPLIKKRIDEGEFFKDIAVELNTQGYQTVRGYSWTLKNLFNTWNNYNYLLDEEK